MKRYRISGFVLGLFAALALFCACDDTNEWDVDSSYDQMFRPVKFETENIEATQVKLVWNGIPGTDHYVMQYAGDSLQFTTCLSFASNNQDTIHVTGVGCELTGLESNTRYSVRLKAVSADAGKKESEWAVLTFKTKSEQIFEIPGVSDISFDKVTLRWTAGAAVTHISISDRTIRLDGEVLTTGEITIDGLTPETEYTVSIFNNTNQRGKLTFTTTPKVPEADNYIYLTKTDSIKSAMFDGRTGSVTVVLPAGEAYYNANAVEIPDGLSVNFFGKVGEKKPVMGIQLLKFPGNHEYITFTNIDITGKYTGSDGKEVKNDYLVNVDQDGDLKLFEFNDCYVHHYNNGAFRMKGGNAVIRTFRMNGCTVYDASNGYAFIIAGVASCSVEHIMLENSTFYNLNRFIEHAKSANISTTVTDCTFNNVIDAGRYLYDGNGSGPTDGLTLKNCIFGKTKSETAKGIRTLSGATVSVENCYSTSDWLLAGNLVKDLVVYAGTSVDLFTGSENGDFTIKDSGFAGKNSAGAQKWRMVE